MKGERVILGCTHPSSPLRQFLVKDRMGSGSWGLCPYIELASELTEREAAWFWPRLRLHGVYDEHTLDVETGNQHLPTRINHLLKLPLA